TDIPPTDLSALSLHDALPIYSAIFIELAAGESAVSGGGGNRLGGRHAEFDQSLDADDRADAVVLMLRFWLAGEFGRRAPVVVSADGDSTAGLNQLLRVSSAHFEADAEVSVTPPLLGGGFGARVRFLLRLLKFLLRLLFGLQLLEPCHAGHRVHMQRADHVPLTDQPDEVVRRLFVREYRRMLKQVNPGHNRERQPFDSSGMSFAHTP